MDVSHAGPMPEKYEPTQIDPRWQAAWAERGTFVAPDGDPRQKMYVLQMFPYPSGDLHAGHIRNYVLGDAVARYWRMRGYNVLHPMGFDSFGLPAEQAAIDRKIHPGEWIDYCIWRARAQFQRYGFSFDWTREVVTSDPAYYRWTQWLFLKLHELGLVYRSDFEVNWCEEHGVLANDEVKDGACWRCEQPVTRRRLEQWVVRTTDYAEELLANLDSLPGWNDAVRTMQRNWIGRSEGTYIDFAVPEIGDGAVGEPLMAPEEGGINAAPTNLRVFTTRVDTVYGVTFMAIAPNHPLAAQIAAAGGTSAQLAQFAESCAREATQYGPDQEKFKRGIDLGIKAINPFSGDGVPIYATNYVLADFGTGAVMGVPAHDERDHAFAKENGLEVWVVIEPSDTGDKGVRPSVAVTDSEQQTTSAPSAHSLDRQGRLSHPHAATTDKGMLVNSGQFSGLDFARAKAQMDAFLADSGLGGAAVTYKLRDWNMSRQRFWGAPIPMVHCEACGWQPVPESELPIRLPDHSDFSDVRVSPLANDEHWQRATCPACKGPARRETDTMTTFMDSAWYFLRFCDPANSQAAFASPRVESWMPVDYYVGGKEHAVGHLLYSRFLTIVLNRAGLFTLTRPDPEGELETLTGEPFRRLFNQGIVHRDGAKMSKSKGNVVSADELADKYGADTARLFAFFGGPYDQDLEWTTAGVEGSQRFLRRVWRLARAVRLAAPGDPDRCGEACANAWRARHVAVAGVTEDLRGWRFNTAIAKLMQYLNTLEDEWKRAGESEDGFVFTSALLSLAQLLSPFAPHIAEELWQQLGGAGLCAESEWPTWDAELLVEDTLELPVQVNGKVRGRVTVAADAPEADVLAAARAEPNVAEWLEGKQVVREMVVPGRMVTFVVKG